MVLEIVTDLCYGLLLYFFLNDFVLFWAFPSKHRVQFPEDWLNDRVLFPGLSMNKLVLFPGHLLNDRLLYLQDNDQRAKLNTLVMFPISALDLRHHMQKKLSSTGQPSTLPRTKLSSSTWSTMRYGRKQLETTDDGLYDLYAVCNHYGDMQGGHYTGNLVDPTNQWEVCHVALTWVGRSSYISHFWLGAGTMFTQNLSKFHWGGSLSEWKIVKQILNLDPV